MIITLSGTVQLQEEENNYLTKTKDLTAVPHDAFREKVCGLFFLVCFFLLGMFESNKYANKQVNLDGKTSGLCLAFAPILFAPSYHNRF